MNHLDMWDKVRQVPETAIKLINGGRLKGMSDINPMWRLKTLTEQFGLCGFGWKYKITNKLIQEGCNNETSAFVDIELFIKVDGEWSEAIPGTGGSSFVSNESKGLYQSDECFKMALTDAISVACKALGIGADVYWSKDNTKYSEKPEQPKEPAKQGAPPTAPTDLEKKAAAIYFKCTGTKEGQFGWTKDQYNEFLKALKDAGKISNTFGKKWTAEDIQVIEEELYNQDALPF
jgi:hypothetical protein